MIEEVLDHLVRGIVQLPDDVVISRRRSRHYDVLEVHVNPQDVGRLIGRRGRTIQALRTVAAALPAGRNVRVAVMEAEQRA